MKFGNCDDCGNYKYLESDGCCRTCSNTGEVRILLDIISDQARDPETLSAIASAIQSEPSVKCTGNPEEFDEDKHDDLDVKPKVCCLYEAGEKYGYEDYNGDYSERVAKAITDALSDAHSIYRDD